jgi:YbgC/YbaW family acyl-CoA thioester hydrolase
MEENKKGIFMNKIKSRIHFYDCDPAGIIFFANIYKIAHDALEELFLLKYIDFNKYKDFTMPIVHSEADYKYPLRFNDEVEISMFLEDIGEHSFCFVYEIYNITAQKLSAIVKVRHVLVEKKTFQKVQLFDELKEILSLFRR